MKQFCAILLALCLLVPLYGGPKQRYSAVEDVDLMAVPTSATVAVSKTVYLTMWRLSNTTAGPITCTITNNAGSPVTLWTGSVPANTVGGDTFPFEDPIRMTSGVKWSCADAGVNGYLSYRY